MNSKKTAIITLVIAIIVGGVGFYGGTAYEKSSLSKQEVPRSANGSPGGSGNRQGGGRTFAGGQGGPNGAQGDFTNGQILSKDDKSITVKTKDGGSKIIFFSDSTAIGKSVFGVSSDLANGQQVMASGKTNADGSLTADNIQIRPDQPNQ